LLNSAFAMAILDLISQVHLPSSVNKLPKYLKHFTFSSSFWSIFIRHTSEKYNRMAIARNKDGNYFYPVTGLHRQEVHEERVNSKETAPESNPLSVEYKTGSIA
jgi:hypothetical protein